MAGPIARASVIGLHVASGLIVGGVIGHVLDRWLGTSFWLPVFLGFGLVAGIMNTVRDIKKLLQEKDLDARDNGRNTPEP